MTPLDVRPVAGEFPPYASIYVDAAAQSMAEQGVGTLTTLLADQIPMLRKLVGSVGADRVHASYAPGKWTLAESLVHVADTERVFSYRLLRIARGDQTPLPGFDQDAWVPASRCARRTLADILTEIESVRSASLALIDSLDDDAMLSTGVSSGQPASVRGLAWMIAGHFAHHLEITRTRYLGEG
ncbi:MAG: DinB family protein [Gemmatimonadaceae bacterium]|nr:DinB family protein [Gemmatimonadaceae bacterium]